uniref:Uncharacterized protein n=1 Tax=Homo sapiens TaxID=9606 RepID=A0A096LPG2_HUMAN
PTLCCLSCFSSLWPRWEDHLRPG